jgi:gas vesicle protein
MANRDGFTGGFLLGTLVGGVVGAVVATIVTNQQGAESEDPLPEIPEGEDTAQLGDRTPRSDRRTRRKRSRPEELNLEGTRQGLEVKIAQLNEAIDDVRRQLGPRNGDLVGEVRGDRVASEESR